MFIATDIFTQRLTYAFKVNFSCDSVQDHRVNGLCEAAAVSLLVAAAQYHRVVAAAAAAASVLS